MSKLSVLSQQQGDFIPIDAGETAIFLIKMLASKNRNSLLSFVDGVHESRKNYESYVYEIGDSSGSITKTLKLDYEDSMGTLTGMIREQNSYSIYDDAIDIKNMPSIMSEKLKAMMNSSEGLHVKDVMETPIHGNKRIAKMEVTPNYVNFTIANCAEKEWEDILPEIEGLIAIG